VRRALLHVALAGLLGIAAAVVGAPIIAASLFGGGTAFLLALGVVAAVVSAGAIGLDLAAGPRRGGRGGSVLRGLVLGVLGSVAGVVIAFAAVRFDVGDGLPVPLRFAAAALPFAALAGLQWRGVVRIVTAGVLVVVTLVVGVPRVQDRVAQDREDAIVLEVGTTARPWITDVAGLRGNAPQTTGSEYIATPYVADDDPVRVVVLLRLSGAAAPGGDPCAGEFYTPEGTFVVTSCATTDGVTWTRSSESYWQQLVRRVDGTWLGATARPDVPQGLLEEALGNARPMTEDEYDAWLDEILPSPAGY
jgi:hypothetical protein